MKFVSYLAFSPLDQYLPMSKACDQAGFEAVAVADHIVHPRGSEPGWPPFTDWPDPWVACAAITAVTERLKVLTSVYILPMRHPLEVAKSVATAASLSGGRVALGAGIGWMREEYDALDESFTTRGARATEMIHLIRRLWDGGWVDHDGCHYSFPALEMSPVPPPIPIYCGGLSRAALERAATHCDGWISELHTTDEISQFIGELSAIRADSPRAGEPFSIIVSCSDAFDLDGYRRLQDLGVTHIQTMPWMFYAGDTSDLDERVDGIHRFGDEIIAGFE